MRLTRAQMRPLTDSQVFAPFATHASRQFYDFAFERGLNLRVNFAPYIPVQTRNAVNNLSATSNKSPAVSSTLLTNDHHPLRHRVIPAPFKIFLLHFAQSTQRL